MKGTGTKRAHLKIAGDYLITPVSEIMKFLKAWQGFQNFHKFKLILDPCAGGLKRSARPVKLREKYLEPGTPMSYPEAFVGFGFSAFSKYEIITNDIRKNSPAQYHFNYLELDISPKPDLIITNPPFFYIKEMISKAYSEIKPKGCVVFLVASTFFASKARFQLWQDLTPDFIFFHSRRMSFWPDGGLDYLNYMHVVWVKRKRPKTTQFILLPQ